MPGPRLSSRNGWENVAPHVFLTQRRVEGFRGGGGDFSAPRKRGLLDGEGCARVAFQQREVWPQERTR